MPGLHFEQFSVGQTFDQSLAVLECASGKPAAYARVDGSVLLARHHVDGDEDVERIPATMTKHRDHGSPGQAGR